MKNLKIILLLWMVTIPSVLFANGYFNITNNTKSLLKIYSVTRKAGNFYVGGLKNPNKKNAIVINDDQTIHANSSTINGIWGGTFRVESDSGDAYCDFHYYGSQTGRITVQNSEGLNCKGSIRKINNNTFAFKLQANK